MIKALTLLYNSREDLDSWLFRVKCVPSCQSAIWFWSKRRVPQHDHVILHSIQWLVNPVYAARHVTGAAGHEH